MLGLSNTITRSFIGNSEWSPSNLSSLKHWYKYNTNITIDAQDDVTEWRDQKGTNHLTATGTSAHSPTFDETTAAVHFNASGDILTFPTTLDLGAFAIYVRCEMSAFDGDFIFKETSNEFWKIHDANNIRLKIQGGTRHDISEGISLSTNTKTNFGLERDTSGDLFAYVNNSVLTWAEGDGNQTITEKFEIETIGKPATDVKFYEIIICSDSISSGDKTNLQAYLANI